MQRGSILPLAAGALALALTVVIGVTSVTSLAIERHRLVALAEATALRASESFDPARLRPGSEELVVPLESTRVRQAAQEFLTTLPAVRHEDLRLVLADTPDGRLARVVLQANWRPPVISEWIPVQLTIDAQAQSRAIIR